MTPRHFELNVSLPSDARFVPAMRDLAAQAARYAGCPGSDADAFAAAVETVVRACLSAAGAPHFQVVLRRGSGPVEVLVECDRRVEPAPPKDHHITIAWVREKGRPMCRIARTMPHGR